MRGGTFRWASSAVVWGKLLRPGVGFVCSGFWCLYEAELAVEAPVHSDGESGTHIGWLLAGALAPHPGDAHLTHEAGDDLMRPAAQILTSEMK